MLAVANADAVLNTEPMGYTVPCCGGVLVCRGGRMVCNFVDTANQQPRTVSFSVMTVWVDQLLKE